MSEGEERVVMGWGGVGLARPGKVSGALVIMVLKYAPRFFEIYIVFQKLKYFWAPLSP